MSKFQNATRYRVRFVDPWFGVSHVGTVWATSLDDAVDRACDCARCEGWQVAAVRGRGGEAEFDVLPELSLR